MRGKRHWDSAFNLQKNLGLATGLELGHFTLIMLGTVMQQGGALYYNYVTDYKENMHVDCFGL